MSSGSLGHRPFNPSSLSFSQAQGYEAIPGILKLEELPDEARMRIWNILYKHIEKDRNYGPVSSWIVGKWAEIVKDLYSDFYSQPLDKWDSDFEHIVRALRNTITQKKFNKVFDFVQFVIRHERCPTSLIDEMQQAFAEAGIAYLIVDDPPTIVPATTKEEGDAIVESMRSLEKIGLKAGKAHLLEASECINRGDWAGSIRESIHAVESVARQLDPKGADTLGPALASIEQRGGLHPALKKAFNKLYGYTSSAQGIRHALLDLDTAEVGMDEAVFMLGACASFASYLSRKHAAQNEN